MIFFILCSTVRNLMLSILKQTINGLEVTKDETEEALKVVFESHNLALAQVWIPYEDEYSVPFSYSLEDTQTKRLLAIKLIGYLYAIKKNDRNDFEPYFRLGDVTSRVIGEELAMETVQDYESCFISVLRSDMLVYWEEPDWFDETSAFAICLRSDNTGDLIYVLEFIWTKQSNYVILLEAVLLTLKRCLPRFKFASGAEIGDELEVHNKDDGTEFMIFQRKRSMVVDDIAHSEWICKTTPNVLPREVIEKQFGKTMKEAAENLNGWDYGLLSPPCALAICLRSNDTGDFSYAFEFIWTQHSNEVIFLENILLTLKRCFLRFKFASGAELGDELDAILVESSTNDEDNEIGVFQEKRSSPMPKAPEKGKKPMVVDPIAPLKLKYKTTPTDVTLEDIGKHYGKTQNEAAKILESNQ
ncbi:hypothetical protein HanXRQr2_Chr02g0070411 [Helianthus annuus]|uniref:NLP1-9 GAF domain-containing protein n=1 Tax=Helianthus annuus TaxID=4232 RepID=A0A9K3JNB3_HELAN|nr:hypothetical protein HanXRQr2_Chr02g0070411 [Helianthus annuus]KAJ0605043.1 hypothetical protein HanHA300_Chr02g0058541 [Helianthus annuus]KAJ0619059.1 hypothetical protein HanHA89_Chr02g0067051 [Helianthus annuus]KAJ0777510.1 hypothetical protein HanLR1_Chr02g0061291 [Helianthus annuus]KAJ0952115.1 hypothetical protein HanPSC8_Chr02g0068351 [Helianthus annuus]